jgi:hypothetical protein
MSCACGKSFSPIACLTLRIEAHYPQLRRSIRARLNAAAESDIEGARDATQTFQRALTASDPSRLRTILPDIGKVQLRLDCFGHQEGFFSSNQVEALFHDYFKSGSAASFEVERIENDKRGYALVHGHVDLIDSDGRSSRAGLHLGLQAEGDRWVLREIRETHR